MFLDNKMGGLKQRPWTPTKRRGPIAAEYSSPGPACVALSTLVGQYREITDDNYKSLFYNFETLGHNLLIFLYNNTQL